jgi:undecaprenyl-diphosphatase
LIGFAVTVILLAIFGHLTDEIVEGETFQFDTQAAAIAHTFVTPALTTVMIVITSFGEWWMMTFIGLCVGFVWWQRRQRGRVVLLATAGLGGAALNQLIKLLVHRVRPDQVGRLVTVQGFSFPSGHAMMSFCFYVTLAYLLVASRPTGVRIAAVVVALVFVGLIGLSRIYLAVHYTSDVIGGFTAGAVWVFTNITAYQLYLRRVPPIIETRD